MKTQYFRRTKQFLSPRQGLFAIIGVVIVVVCILLRIFAPGVIAAIATPFWNTGTFITDRLGVFQNTGALEARIAALQEENELLATENRTLHAALGTPDDPSPIGIVAGVIARPPLAPYDVFVIGKGTDDGVMVGMKVYVEGIPAGTIETAGTGSAHVALYSASGRATEGWIGEGHVPVTVRGVGAGAFEADVPRDAAIAVGDAVYLPGLGALPIGSVVSVENQPSSPRSTVGIRPIVNPFATIQVVVTPSS